MSIQDIDSPFLLDDTQRKYVGIKNPDGTESELLNNANASYNNGGRPTVVVLGDSRVENAISSSINYEPSRSWAMHTLSALNGRMTYLYNAGVGGQDSSQMLARFDKDVVSRKPTWCWMMGPVNDFIPAKNFEVSKSQSNIITIYEKCKQNNISFAISTIQPWPNYNTDVSKTKHAQFNRWLIEFCAGNRIPCVDEYTPLADPAGNGESFIDPAYAWDVNGHPSTSGARVIGEAWYKVFDPILPYNPVTMSAGTTINPYNAYANQSGFPVGAALPTGWSQTGTATAITSATEARPDGLPGTVMRITGTGTANAQYLGVTAPTMPMDVFRTNSEAVVVGNRRIMADGNDYMIMLPAHAGTTSASAPAFNNQIGAITVDGTATWTRVANFRPGNTVIFEMEYFTSGISGGNLGFMPACFITQNGGSPSEQGRVMVHQDGYASPLIVPNGVLRSKPFIIPPGTLSYSGLYVAYINAGVTGTIKIGRIGFRHFPLYTGV